MRSRSGNGKGHILFSRSRIVHPENIQRELEKDEAAQLLAWWLRQPRSIQRRRQDTVLRYEGGRYVYYALRDNLVKIGYSSDPHRRVKAFQAKLIAYEVGGSALEKARHRRFAHLREHGEWFRYEGELKNWVEDMVAQTRADLTR